MNVLLVGGSGTFGAALKHEAESRKIDLIRVSRAVPDKKSFYCDLSDTLNISDSFRKINDINENTIAIINSGVIGPIGLGSEADFESLVTAFNVNAMSNLPIFQVLYSRGVTRFIVVSSGAAKKDYSGWFTYCQSKKLQKSLWESFCHDCEDVSVKFVAPGVLDSAMHEFTSFVDRSKYPELDKFYEINKTGGYQKPDESASKVFDLMSREGFFKEGSEFIDLRDL